MKLVYQKDHISIKKFKTIELPDFVILTGMNGTGKSHLLEAIENKSVTIEGEGTPRIALFDFKTFYLENESAYNARQIIDERNNAWNFLQSNAKGSLEAFKNSLGQNYEKLVSIAVQNSTGLLNLSKKEIQDPTLFNQFQNYKKSVKNYFNQENFKNNLQVQSVFPLTLISPYGLEDLKKEYFDDIFRPYQLKNDFLPDQLGKVLWDYYLKYRNNEINEFENAKHDKKYPFLSEKKFVALHGKKPWAIINQILDKFHTIEYRIPSPEGSDYFGDYQFKLEHLTKNFKINFSALSSGEKVLMALVASIYKSSSDHHFPDILLLDEIDASLHPSMIKNLLDTIKEIFLINGAKVILVSHSPTCVAIAPEESIYIMNKEGVDRIQKKTKNEALSILTEGYATLEEGLRIFDEIGKKDISVISEGKNIKLLEKAFELFSVTDVDIITQVEDISGDSQLKTIFDFLCKIPHSKKVIIVWDPDVTYGLTGVNNTYPFILQKNPKNTIASRGIENLFDESLFESFKTRVVDSLGNERMSFDSNRKNDFIKFIIERNNKADFINFKPLINIIAEITGKSYGLTK